MTKPDLAALSEAATPGAWAVDGPPHNRIIWSSPDDRVCFMAHSDGKDVARDMATPAFIVALVNAYRSGDLVLIDREGMRDKLIAAMLAKLGPLFGSPEYLADPVKLARAEKRRQDSAEAYADAAIAAILREGV